MASTTSSMTNPSCSRHSRHKQEHQQGTHLLAKGVLKRVYACDCVDCVMIAEVLLADKIMQYSPSSPPHVHFSTRMRKDLESRSVWCSCRQIGRARQGSTPTTLLPSHRQQSIDCVDQRMDAPQERLLLVLSMALSKESAFVGKHRQRSLALS